MGIGEDEAFGRWRSALGDSLNSPGKVMAWQDRRYDYAYRVGQLLVNPSPDGTPMNDHVVYGVYVAGGVLVYVGQTRDARRRLRDLLVGESHHLATTIPPEIWERVIVVQWPVLLNQISDSERRIATDLGLKTCGLAMEHLLQLNYLPVMATRRRLTTGGWAPRNIAKSRSKGARVSGQLPELFRLMRDRWDGLAKVQWSGQGDPVVYSEAGRAAFPGSLGVDGRLGRQAGTGVRTDAVVVDFNGRLFTDRDDYRYQHSKTILLMGVAMCADEACDWTVIGFWLEDEPVATGVVAGHHEVDGGSDCSAGYIPGVSLRGPWAMAVSACCVVEAEVLAARKMMALDVSCIGEPFRFSVDLPRSA